MPLDYSELLFWLIFGCMLGYVYIYFYNFISKINFKQKRKELSCILKGHLPHVCEPVEIACRVMLRNFDIIELMTVCSRCDECLSIKMKDKNKKIQVSDQHAESH